jgi:serine/threonine protein kinase
VALKSVTIGDYKIIGLFGVGGMGSVYRVQNLITNRQEALKVLLPDLRTALDLAERFGRDARSDLYSLLVTFYEILSGRWPFESRSEYDVMRGHLEREPVPLTSLNPDLPYPMPPAVLRAMAKRPEDRFQTAQEFRIPLELTHQSREETVPGRQ